MRKIVASMVFVACAALNASAHAAVLFDNPFNGASGDCSFSTTCASSFSRGDDYAAQFFTLTSNSTVSSGSFSVIDFVKGDATEPHQVNYLFLANNGADGSPGSVIAQGSQAILSHDAFATGGNYGSGFRNTFNITPLDLNAGSYYFAVQGVSSEALTFLGTADGTGAYETHDGGATWGTNYQGFSAVAVSLSGGPDAPAPLLGMGLVPALGSVGGLVATRFRRRKTANA